MSDLNVNVVDGGQVLEYTVFWPSALTNMQQLHKIWTIGKGVAKVESYHPQIKIFLPFLSRMMKKRTDQRVQSRACIYLPFVVETRFELFFLS